MLRSLRSLVPVSIIHQREMIYSSIYAPNDSLTTYYAHNEALSKFDEMQQLNSNREKVEAFTMYSVSSSFVEYDELEHDHLFSTAE